MSNLHIQQQPTEHAFFRCKLPPRRALYNAVCACLFGLSSGIPMQTQAAEIDGSCLPALIFPVEEKLFNDQNSDERKVEASRLLQPDSNHYRFEGDVVYQQNQLQVKAQSVDYDRNSRQAEFTDGVELQSKDILVSAKNAVLKDQPKGAQLNDTHFQLLPSRAHGSSKKIQYRQEDGQAVLEKTTISTCPIDKQHKTDWFINVDRLTVDQSSRRVIAKDAVFYFKDVPIFYSPYFNYPLDDRASGLLFPQGGSYKSLTQTDPSQYLKVPYYFNIAPNMDDTLTLMPMTQRGLVLDNEFRYMGKHKAIEHSAVINLSFLNDDLTARDGLVSTDSNGDLVYGKKQAERWRGTISARQNWGHGFSSQLQWIEVSDPHFFNDIPVDIALKNKTQTPRFARVDYQSRNFSAYATMFGFLKLQNAPTNYEKRPEVGFNFYQAESWFDFNLSGQAVRFDLEDNPNSDVVGNRYHLNPSLVWSKQKTYGGITATAASQMVKYDLENQPSDSEPTSAVPQFALDAHLVFERTAQIFGESYRQSLIPKIQYLYVPYEDQSSQPIFDTQERSLDFSNLFAMNRFSGNDRVGDDNRVSVALTTQFENAQGQQVADFGIGQMFYFADRKVGVETSPATITDRRSDYYLKAGIGSPQLYISSTLLVDENDGSLQGSSSRFSWQPSPKQQLLISHYRHPQNSSLNDTVSAGGYSQLDQNWQLGGYVEYDLKAERLYETNLGFRYDSCCWAAEFVAERTQLENGLYNDGFQMQFELKGLSSNGNRFKNDLANKFNY
ncbi:LPS-assembly protein LptD [Thiomicrorhabdus heinhorstiae]|uniref:LPS-assembly protein LptD n=1 Tax=Thiomicrorhabdus heinhorstiae TaxID=2748010 RepID=A0ABS0BVS3_9GAMM|nr:LPS assembly protein LptD [Thiomicrorhabdus heinhorstiae]MBF6057173.1 LPS-assembly protein LptD [Thiomicrorhabdus heinhorstiae]